MSLDQLFEDDDEDEGEAELDGEVELEAEDEEQLDAELGEARDYVLEDVRELLDDYVLGRDSAADILRELQADLAEWEEDLDSNPFEPDHPQLAAAWNDATDSIRDGYRLLILGIERDQPEFFETGFGMIERGVHGREAVLNAE